MNLTEYTQKKLDEFDEMFEGLNGIISQGVTLSGVDNDFKSRTEENLKSFITKALSELAHSMGEGVVVEPKDTESHPLHRGYYQSGSLDTITEQESKIKLFLE